MAGKTDFAEAATLNYHLKGTVPSYHGDTTAKLALFTADPGESGSLAAEANYTGYARITITRATFWTAAAASSAEYESHNAADQAFGECTAGTNTITHAAVLTAANEVLYYGPLDASIAISAGVTPIFPAGSLVMKEG